MSEPTLPLTAVSDGPVAVDYQAGVDVVHDAGCLEKGTPDVLREFFGCFDPPPTELPRLTLR